MASLKKTCSCGRENWDTCRHTWLLRTRVGGKDVYRGVGSEKRVADRALARERLEADETVSQTVGAWVALKRSDPGARPNSLSVYRSRAKHITAYFGDTPTRSIRPEHLTRFVSDLLATEVKPGRRMSPATVQGIYAALTACLRHARRRGVIPHLPLPEGGVGIGAAPAREHRLTLDEVEVVIGRLVEPWRSLGELILLTGLRFGEAVAVERQDIEGLALRVKRTRNQTGGTNPPKTRAGIRVVPLSPRAAEILEGVELPVAGDYRDARKALVAALGDLHQPGIGWHTIRNAHASLLEAAGVPLRDQAARMGHGVNTAQTLSYGLLSEAGSADALDAVRQRPSPSGGESSPEDELAPRRAARRRGPQAG